MSKEPEPAKFVTPNLWQELGKFTQARIAQGRVGFSQTTTNQLAFQLDHAQARDAVHVPLDFQRLSKELDKSGFDSLMCSSKVQTRTQYLQRPDLGRQLSKESVDGLNQWKSQNGKNADIVIAVADGLSSTAIQNHAIPLINHFHSGLAKLNTSPTPVCLVSQGRVAVGDHIGEILKARATILLIGERPGLSSPDSLGVYYTYGPQIGRTDADRNCISNIRPEGLTYDQAARKLLWLVNASFNLGFSGIRLKEESGEEDTPGVQLNPEGTQSLKIE